MLKKKYINIVAVYAACFLPLLGCSEGSNDQNNQTGKSLSAMNADSAQIESVDIYRMYDKKNIKLSDEQCFDGKSVCVSQGTEFKSSYVKIKDEYVWLIKDVTGHFDVDIDNKSVKIGSLKVVKLSANLNGNNIQGHIAELDDTSCNIGAEQDDDSCVIKMTYSADTPENGRKNTHYMELSWLDNSGVAHSGVVNFDTSNDFKTNQSLPVLSGNGDGALDNQPNIIDQQGHDEYEFAMTNYIVGQLKLTNVGDDVLMNASQITPLVSANTHYFNLNNLSYYNVDAQGKGYIKCASQNLPIKEACSLNFTYKNYLENNIFDSQVGRIAFKYKLDPTESTTYLYNKKYIISPGLFATDNYDVNLQTGKNTDINLILSRLYNLSRISDPTSISYRFPINNLELSIEANDGVYLPYYFDKEHIYYGIGDENKANINKLNIMVDKKDIDIFESSAPDYINSTMYSAHIQKKALVDDNAIFGGVLVAKYYVPDLKKSVRQIIGTINLKNKPEHNDALCNYIWRDNNFEYFDGCARSIVNFAQKKENHKVYDINLKVPLTGEYACVLNSAGYCANAIVTIGEYASDDDYQPSSWTYQNLHDPSSNATSVYYSSTYKQADGNSKGISCVKYDERYPWYYMRGAYPSHNLITQTCS